MAVISTPTPLRKPHKTARLLAQRIVDEIVDADLEPGTPLLAEAEMMKKYRIARGTLRETLRFLEIQGVLSIKTGPGGGAVVAEPGSRALASTLGLLLQLSRASYRCVVEARLALEPVLARMAAAQRGAEDVEVMAASVDAMKASIDDEREFLAQNEMFHLHIARAAGNPVLFHMAASLARIEDGSALGMDYARDTRGPIVAHHRRILAAIEAGDPDMAEAAMRLHLGAFAKYAIASYGAVLDRPLRWDQVG
jgi:DNA-binding FadR family transcriptional regulator